MSECEDCKYHDKDYCILFDDILSYENCIFKGEKDD